MATIFRCRKQKSTELRISQQNRSTTASPRPPTPHRPIHSSPPVDQSTNLGYARCGPISVQLGSYRLVIRRQGVARILLRFPRVCGHLRPANRSSKQLSEGSNRNIAAPFVCTQGLFAMPAIDTEARGGCSRYRLPISCLQHHWPLLPGCNVGVERSARLSLVTGLRWEWRD